MQLRGTAGLGRGILGPPEPKPRLPSMPLRRKTGAENGHPWAEVRQEAAARRETGGDNGGGEGVSEER